MTSIGNWIFDFSNPVLIPLSLLLLISLVLTSHAVLKRLFNRYPLRAFAVIVLNVVAYIAVLILLLEPRHPSPGEQSLVLVTEGANPALVTTSTNAKLYVTPAAVTTSTTGEYPVRVNGLLDTAQLPLREPNLTRLEVLGYGLSQDQWTSFPSDVQIDFDPPPVNGFTNTRWKRTLSIGETLQVNGRYLHTQVDKVLHLRLLDPANNIVKDTPVIGSQFFNLSVPVKARGNLEYRIQAWSGDKLLSEQPVPVTVNTPPPLGIMIEQSAPSFETRQLKDYAAANGHRVLVNSAISKGKSISQTANLPAGTETSLSPQTLASQDVLIMDGRALVDLPDTRKQWLIEAVEGGLGLLVLADSVLLDNFDKLSRDLLIGFQLSPQPDPEAEVIPRLVADPTLQWQEPLPAQAISLSADNGEILVDDNRGNALVINRKAGMGNISISLIRQSHGWLTSGNMIDWSNYWSSVIASIAKPRDVSYLLHSGDSDFYRMNKRTAICALTTEEGMSVVIDPAVAEEQTTAIELKLAADDLNSARQCAYFWPQNSGWHQVQLMSDISNSALDQTAIYIFQPYDWLAQQRAERAQATRVRAAGTIAALAAKPQEQVTYAVSVFWPWLILVLSATLLWLERKLTPVNNGGGPRQPD